jgi:ubiquinone/menaquinone biosynthesis C-methylase UbiE
MYGSFTMNFCTSYYSLIAIIILGISFKYLYHNDKLRAVINIYTYDNDQVKSFHNSMDTLPQYLMNKTDNFGIFDLNDFQNEVESIRSDNGTDESISDMHGIFRDMCAICDMHRMYVAPCLDESASINANQQLYEKDMAKRLQVTNGEILDLGCGIGRIADNVSNETNSIVHGINIDANHIEYAKKYATQQGNNKTRFSVASFNDKLKFENNSLDGAYDLGAILYSYNLLDTFKEIYRVLKPGGRYLTLSPVLLDKFDKNNEYHKYLLNCNRRVGEWTYAIHYKYIEQIGKEAGFKVISSNIPGNI